ncbi:CAP domain-containing protein [Sphingomonas sp. BIUV-7]|uniref:CAP domain-containing protein n=1 Tax=Sphingomonas natans TaxID=3063330 RepID=A0ABT8Y3U7_9SPHN|nr:CAP domain-containing protein [Sphingomonas sp. BIUV-7]MDO6412989.1 CAP domain-containing protein [Sphingomonas sp. BIUV-7]
MRAAGAIAAASLVLATVPATATVVGASTGLEAQVFAALNAMRAEPGAHVADLRSYRQHLRGKIVTMPGTRISYRTREGAVPVDEALTFLSGAGGRVQLASDPVLAAAAADHVAQQSRSGRTGHFGADGSGPWSRVERRGGGGMVTEVIAYGAFDAADVVRQLVVDDGVPNRGHRRAVFASHLRYAGVACGPHPTFRTMCVIDMADAPGGQMDDRSARFRIASAR